MARSNAATDSVTRILAAEDVSLVLDTASSIAAVERGFQLSGEDIESKVMGFHAQAGGFHIKSALMRRDGGTGYFAAKINANFPANPARRLPTIQGILALFETATGRLLALIDSSSITVLRTAAASAVAAKALANEGSRTLTIVGCGAQAAAHLHAISAVRPIETVFATDRDMDKARAFAKQHTSPVRSVSAVDDFAESAKVSDIIVTCTSSRRAFLESRHVKAGTFIAAVGADNEEKQEIAPQLMASCVVVVDSLEQCAAFGDLHHALESGVVDRRHVRGELSDFLGGAAGGRRSPEEIIIFDSTGVAFQDVVCAAVAYEHAVELNLGTTMRLGAS